MTSGDLGPAEPLPDAVAGDALRRAVEPGVELPGRVLSAPGPPFPSVGYSRGSTADHCAGLTPRGATAV
ncbi:hypothetical protein AB0I10_19905 [Streptomyces sp. NPDC050636]|uniref:hypothetical protein n=1 Tax=Streptomyces sp. NPDC050636 TaxID=3154510 RepID=UPI00343610AB